MGQAVRTVEPHQRQGVGGEQAADDQGRQHGLGRARLEPPADGEQAGGGDGDEIGHAHQVLDQRAAARRRGAGGAGRERCFRERGQLCAQQGGRCWAAGQVLRGAGKTAGIFGTPSRVPRCRTASLHADYTTYAFATGT